jgi:predicted nucleic acid-binding protein
MATIDALADTSFIYSLFDKTDSKHEVTRTALNRKQATIVMPDVVLADVAYLFRARVGVHAVIKLMDGLVAHNLSEPVIIDDLKRICEIMATYAEARFDFVDCCIMALAERLNVTRVYTFDHRDFHIFRPKHCNYLELLP